MDGASALRAVLVAAPAVTGRVPAERIVCGILDQGTVLPAIRLWKVSGVDRNLLKAGATRRVTHRVQAEVHGDTEPEAREILALLRAAAADQIIASLGDIAQLVILTDGEGPSGIEPETQARVETQDFKVSYNQSR